MSFQAVDNAAKLTGITSTEKLVLMILCTFHNGDKKSPRFNQCNPSHQTIADRAGLARQSVSRIILELTKKGIISYETDKKQGINSSSRYDLSKFNSNPELQRSNPELQRSNPELHGDCNPELHEACNTLYPVSESVNETVNEAALEKEHCAKNAQSPDANAPSPTPKKTRQKTVKPEKPKPFYETIEIPDFIDREMWLGWQRERKEKFKSKAAYTAFAINQHLLQLTELHNEGFNANAALVLIRSSVWQGVNKNVCIEKLQAQKNPLETGSSSINKSGSNYATKKPPQHEFYPLDRHGDSNAIESTFIVIDDKGGSQ